MSNVKSIISSHNKSVLKDQSVTSASQVDKDCNCRKKYTCPPFGKCLTTNAVYQAKVTRDDTNEQETYVGHTECQFETRDNGNMHQFFPKREIVQDLYRSLYAFHLPQVISTVLG